MRALPVDAIRPELTAALGDAAPIVLTAPTGSGKSTRLPLWLAEETGRPCLVVEPRRVACRSLAGYLAGQRGERVGESIGYSIRFEDKRSKNTEVLFVTPGVALRLLAAPKLAFGSVVLDEFHERGWEIDLIAAILRERKATGALDGPLVFTSATLQVDALAGELGARVLEAQGRAYPVDIEYMGEVFLPTRQDLERRVERAVGRAVSEGDGEVLVFLPGKAEIGACFSALSRRAGAWGIEPLEVHASLPPAKMKRVFEEASGPRRRVYLSTNVAETSITLPGVTWVIDSGLARMQLHRAGRTALALTPIAHDSMEQRAGRAGRVAPGTCLRLWEKHWAPPRATSPEIERVALDDFILRAAICGLDGADFDAAPWVTPPPDFATDQARDHLRGVGALDATNRITTHGRALAGLPVSAFEARLLHEPPKALATALADVVAILQRGRRMTLRLDQLRRDADKVRDAREDLFEGCTNEVFEALRVLRAGHAERHGLRRATLEETRRLAKQLRAAIGAPTDVRADGMDLPDADALARHLFTRAPEVGFALRPRAQGAKAKRSRSKSKSKPWGNGEVELMVDPFVPLREDDRPREGDETIAGAILDHAWLGDSKGLGVTGRGSMLLPASPKLMADCGLGEVSITDVRARKGKVVANVRRELAGATLSSREEKLRGPVLCTEAARLILKNQLMRGAGALVLDDLHLLELLSRWRHTNDTEHFDLDRLHALELPGPQAFLSGRLSELGLTTSDELELLEADDLRPDVVSLTKLAAWDIDPLREDFPRIWTYQSCDYACSVNLAARRVTIEPANKAARSRKEPPRGVLPRFRGFSVVFKQDSRTLPLRS